MLGHSLLLVTLSAFAAVMGSSCNVGCEGGSQTIWAVECGATGSATLSSPARLGLPATVPVTGGYTCMETNGRCERLPILILGTSYRRDQFGFRLGIELPAMQGSASYTLPMSQPQANITLAYVSKDVAGNSTNENLRVVSGTITVEESSAIELRVSFALELELPSTMERLSITGGTAKIGGCKSVGVTACIND